MVFTPFYLPLVGLMALFMFSYLGLMPWAYKLQVLTLVYVFTILLPTILIHLYRRYKGWNLIDLGHKDPLLFLLCLSDGSAPYSPLHGYDPLSSAVHSDHLCLD